MTRGKLLSILQEETDGFKEQSRLRDDVLDAMEQAYIKGTWTKKPNELS